MRKFKMESRKRLGDVVQLVGQKYYPCTPSSLTSSWHFSIDVLSSNDLFNHINTLREIITEDEQFDGPFIPSLNPRSRVSIVHRSPKYLEDGKGK
jgi:hypothetical protein